MPTVGAVLSTLSTGARAVAALSRSDTAINAYNSGTAKLDSLNNRAAELIGRSDLANYPNLQSAMETPEGRSHVAEAYQSMDRSTPFRKREELQKVMGPPQSQKIESYNYHPGPSESDGGMGVIGLPVRSG